MSFHNDGQFPISHESLADILRQYDIASFTYVYATGGIENTTCFIKTPSQRYALRVYRYAKKPTAAMMREMQYMDVLREHGLPIPQVYSNNAGRSITTVHVDGAEWQAILMEYMHGTHPVSYSPNLLRHMAQVQASMHTIGAGMPGGRITLTELVEGEFVKRLDMSTISGQRARRYIERISSYAVQLGPTLPCGYSHFDFDMGNILVGSHNKLVAILDFDDLQYAPLVICLAYTLWSILFETGDMAHVEQYLAVYQQYRNLTPLERAYLPRIMLFRHYVITALKMLNGHTQAADITRYESLEQLIRDVSL